MNIKTFIKLFIPPVILVIKRKLFPSKFEEAKKTELVLEEKPLPKIESKTDKFVILGNGPSLNKSIELYKDIIMRYDRMVCNFFASTNLFEEIKPNYYIFADPAFFYVPEQQKNSIGNLIQSIVNKTTWNMTIIIPYSAKEAPLVSEFAKNGKIKTIFYYNKKQNIENISKFEAWDKNLIGPPAQNVINVATYIALYWEYKETYLLGVDTSSLEDLRIDQTTNEIFSIDKHFYEKDKVYSDTKMFNAKQGRLLPGWTLHGYIYAIGKMLEGYAELREYADYKKLPVYNASEYSWINSFERKKLS